MSNESLTGKAFALHSKARKPPINYGLTRPLKYGIKLANTEYVFCNDKGKAVQEHKQVLEDGKKKGGSGKCWRSSVGRAGVL